MEALSRPPVPSSPRPSRMKEPRSRPAAHLGQRARVDHRGPQLGQLAFGQVGVGAVQRVRDHQAEHRVPEELQPLVGGQTAVLVRVRAVGQRTHQKGGLELYPSRPSRSVWDEACPPDARVAMPPAYGSRARCGQLLAHEASHQPLRPRGPGACCRCRSSGTRCAAASARGSARTPPGWGPQPSTATGGGACCCATSSASEQPRLLLLLLVDAALRRRSVVLLAVLTGPGESLQCRPTDVDGVVVVVRVVRQAHAAFGAQTRAVVPAHRLHRQCEHHRITQHGLEVEQVARRACRRRRLRRGRRRPGRRTSPGSPLRALAPNGSRHLTHSPVSGARAVPVTSTPP